MSISKLQSLAQGVSGNMTGADIASSVNQLIDLATPCNLSLNDLIIELEATEFPVGSIVKTIEYHSNTGLGGNTYQILDAGSSSSRPDADGGSVIHVGEDGLYLKGLFLNGYWVGQFGATGLKGIDASEAFKACFLYVANTAYKDPSFTGLGLSNAFISGQVNIDHPKEVHYISNPRSMMQNTGTSYFRKVGLAYVGHTAATRIHFDYDGDDYLLYNDNEFLKIQFRNLTFSCDSENAKFLYSFANGGAQDYLFHACNWTGTWNNIYKIRGGNNNSEWAWYKCSWGCNVETEVMDLEGSDQFLNYVFDTCYPWIYKGGFLKATNGGHFKFINCDASGMVPDEETYFIRLLGTSHSRGVCSFQWIGGRCEHKNDNSRFLECEWEQGNVVINGDFASSLYDDPETTHCKFTSGNGSGANIEFKGSQLIGQHVYSGLSNSFVAPSKATYDACSFTQHDDPTLAVIQENSVSHPNRGGDWIIDINPNCKVSGSLPGVGVLVGTQIGAWRAMGGHVKDFSAIFRDAQGMGNPRNTAALQLRLPGNAVITRIWMYSAGTLTSVSTCNFQVRADIDTDGNVGDTLLTETGDVRLDKKWNVDTPILMHRVSPDYRNLRLIDANNVSNQVSSRIVVRVFYIGGEVT